MKFRKLLLGCLLSLPLVAGAQAPDYPERPITFVVPFAAGGPTDLVARILGEKLANSFGQPIVAQNRGGATGLIGQTHVMRAKPDGYTLLIASNSSHILAPLSQPEMPYDPVADFAPISMLGRYPLVLNVNPEVPANNVNELIGLAEKEPGKLNFGSVGIGSVIHMTGEQFKSTTQTDILHIPYNGTPGMTTALMSGEIDMHFNSISNTKPLVDAGSVRALAVTGDKRVALLPDVPTLAEAGIEGVDAHVWLGVFAPKDTPRPILDKLETEIRHIMDNDAEIRKIFHDNGFEIVANTSADFSVHIEQEQAQWKKLMNSMGL